MKGWFAYKSKLGPTVTAMQVEGVYDIFLKLFNQIKFDAVIEIGTAQGGTTLMVRDALNESGNRDCRLTTYDPGTTERFFKCYADAGEVTKLEENVFSDGYTKLNPESSIPEHLSKEGKNLILCDGGCKWREFNYLAPLLKSGDFIMAHDYAKDSEYFNSNIKGKIWDWHEIKFSHIESSFKNNNLDQFMEEEFAKHVWLCCRKK